MREGWSCYESSEYCHIYGSLYDGSFAPLGSELLWEGEVGVVMFEAKAEVEQPGGA